MAQTVETPTTPYGKYHAHYILGQLVGTIRFRGLRDNDVQTWARLDEILADYDKWSAHVEAELNQVLGRG